MIRLKQCVIIFLRFFTVHICYSTISCIHWITFKIKKYSLEQVINIQYSVTAAFYGFNFIVKSFHKTTRLTVDKIICNLKIAIASEIQKKHSSCPDRDSKKLKFRPDCPYIVNFICPQFCESMHILKKSRNLDKAILSSVSDVW